MMHHRANMGLLLSALWLLIALSNGNRVGWEGDDLNLLAGAVGLKELGTAEVYRYAWQPLAYEFLHFAALWIQPAQLVVLAHLAGALGFIGLMHLCGRWQDARNGPWVMWIVGLSLTELWITGLYVNTTALGLPGFVLALSLLVQSDGRVRDSRLFRLGSSAAFAMSWAFRLDFATAGLFMLLLACRDAKSPLRAAIDFIAIQVTAVALLLQTPGWWGQLIDIVTQYRGEVFPGWTAMSSVKVLLVYFYPGAIVLPLLLAQSGLSKLMKGSSLALATTLLPTLAGIGSLYSGKYLVVTTIGLLVWFMIEQRRLTTITGRIENQHSKKLSLTRQVLGFSVLSIGLMLPLPDPGQFRPGRASEGGSIRPWSVYTHDGPRTFGDMPSLLASMRSNTSNPSFTLARQTVEAAVSTCPQGLDVHMHPTSHWTWGQVLWPLFTSGWTLSTFQPEGPVMMVLTRGPSTLRLLRSHVPQSSTTVVRPRLVFDDFETMGTEAAEPIMRERLQALSLQAECQVNRSR